MKLSYISLFNVYPCTLYVDIKVIEDAKNVDESRIKLVKNAGDNDDNAQNDQQNAQNLPRNKKMKLEFINEMQNTRKKIMEKLSLDKVEVKYAFKLAGKVVDKNNNGGGNPDRAEQANNNGAGAGNDIKKKKHKHKLASKFEYGSSPKTLEQLEQWLADDEIDNDGKDLFGWTALHKVIFWQKNEYVLPLLQNMSSESINCIGPEGEAPIHMALALVLNGGKKKILEWLCENPKIDKTVKNKKGKTALQIAQENNANDQVIQLLSN